MAEEKARDPTKPEVKPVNIPLSKIHDLPGSVFAPPSQKSLEALTSSIVLKGVQEPVILRQREDGDFQIVSGNRRRKASELAKKTEIPAFVYDMTEKEARDFRLRGNAKGTPPGKLLPENEIGKKREAPAKAEDKAAEKAPVTPPKPSEKTAAAKPAPAPEPKRPEGKPKEAVPTEKANADGKKPDAPPLPEKPTEGKAVPESGSKKPDEKSKTASSEEKANTDSKAPATQPKPLEKTADTKSAPTSEQKKPEEKPKAAPSVEKADADGKKQDVPPSEKSTEGEPAPESGLKKPDEKSKTAAPEEKTEAGSKAPAAVPKPPEKSGEVKPASVPEQKKPEEKPKTAPPAEKADVDSKAPATQPKPLEKPVEAKPAPAYMPGPAALGPTGTKITKIFEDRLLPPDEKAMKDLPVPKDGESYFITLHPAYLEKSEFNTVSVDTSSDDYKELKKSIELNGVKDPVLTRINPKGGLEVLSGQRRHMIARELNYPVPAIIQKIDDNDAMILVADSNLHRPHISTYDLSRTLRNKMTAMKRKAGRKKRGEVGADELQSDAVLAKEMGISVSRLNRIVRLSEATKDVCDAVDDHSIELSIAAEISFLKPHNQDEVIHLAGIGYKPNVKRVQRLRTAEKNGKLDDMTMRNILEDKDIQPVKPPEPPKSAPVQPDPPFPVASMVTPSVSPAPEAPDMKPIAPAPQKQETTPPPPAAQAAEKPEAAPELVSNIIPIPTESKQPGESKADEEPIEFNSQRDNMYATKVTLGGDRLRKYFPDVSMKPIEIVESIYSALEERRQREIRAKQKTEILHPGKPAPTR